MLTRHNIDKWFFHSLYSYVCNAYIQNEISNVWKEFEFREQSFYDGGWFQKYKERNIFK